MDEMPLVVLHDSGRIHTRTSREVFRVINMLFGRALATAFPHLKADELTARLRRVHSRALNANEVLQQDHEVDSGIYVCMFLHELLERSFKGMDHGIKELPTCLLLEKLRCRTVDLPPPCRHHAGHDINNVEKTTLDVQTRVMSMGAEIKIHRARLDRVNAELTALKDLVTKCVNTCESMAATVSQTFDIMKQYAERHGFCPPRNSVAEALCEVPTGPTLMTDVSKWKYVGISHKPGSNRWVAKLICDRAADALVIIGSKFRSEREAARSLAAGSHVISGPDDAPRGNVIELTTEDKAKLQDCSKEKCPRRRGPRQPPLVQLPLEQPPLDPQQPPLAPGAAAPGPRDAAPGPHGADPAAACDAAPGPGAAASLCCPLPPVAARACAARCCSPPPPSSSPCGACSRGTEGMGVAGVGVMGGVFPFPSSSFRSHCCSCRWGEGVRVWGSQGSGTGVAGVRPTSRPS
ncbi:unnamed protein product [Closterium sp. NIES-54]